MTVGTILLIVYSVLSMAAAVYTAQDAWRNGFDESRRHDPVTTVLSALLLLLIWPFFAITIGLGALVEWGDSYARRHP